MKKQSPTLINIEQIFGKDQLKDLETIIDSPFPSQWGNDRIVSLKDNDTSVKNQFDGTCTAFAVIGAIENKLGGEVDLSERSLWNGYRRTNTQDAVITAQEDYVLEEEYWPQEQLKLDTENINKGRYRLNEVNYLGNNYQNVLKAIDRGNPCVVALRTPKDLRRGYKQIEGDSKVYRWAGHAMCVSGYKVENGKAYFLVKNSYGPDFGDSGYQYISFDVLKGRRRRYGFFWEISSIEDRGTQAQAIVSEETI